MGPSSNWSWVCDTDYWLWRGSLVQGQGGQRLTALSENISEIMSYVTSYHPYRTDRQTVSGDTSNQTPDPSLLWFYTSWPWYCLQPHFSSLGYSLNKPSSLLPQDLCTLFYRLPGRPFLLIFVRQLLPVTAGACIGWPALASHRGSQLKQLPTSVSHHPAPCSLLCSSPCEMT